MNRSLWVALALGITLSIVVVYRIAHLSLVFGSEEGRWVYGYIWAFRPRSILFSAIALVIAGLPITLGPDVVRRWEWWIVLYCLIAGTLVQVRLRTLTPYSLARVFKSDGSNGFYGATRQYRAAVLLKDFDRMRSTLTIHPRSNMPGKLVLVYALEKLSVDPGTLALLVIVLSNLGGVVLYALARELSADPVVATTSFVFYLFVPGKLFFFPVLNTVTPAILLVCIYLWLRAIQGGNATYSVALGIGLFGVTMFEPLPLVTGIIFAALGWRALVTRTVNARTLATHLVLTAASYVLLMLMIGLWLHFDMPTVLKHLVAEAVEFNAAAQRPYRIWVWRDMVDFAIATGMTQTLMFVALLVGFAASLDGSRRQELCRNTMAVFTLSLAAALMITDILGVNRGETARLWIFFSCLVQMPAAYACVRLRTRIAALATLATSIVIAAVGTSMMAFAQP